MAVLLEYEGTRYAGSQYQKNADTVQAALERAVSRLTGESVRVALAGRTDAGVHAKGQVVSFLSASTHTSDVLARGLNFHLPDDIAVRKAAEAPLRFDVRRQAVSRWYRYTVCRRGPRPALLRRYAWHVEEPLDAGVTAEAARALVGEHDFAAFTRPSLKGRSGTVRRVQRAEVLQRGDLLLFDIEANAFLPHQVRRTVGTLVRVGRGRMPAEEFERLVTEAPPGAARYAAPPQGLCLMRVRYEIELFGNETREDVQS
ncbi:MAG: tRNA pseudouridine(38-40) synthase TruA [Chloroflexi bacterium]|nr:tRNA pseudouridine(38-40) synthase TruA [Chloroflexota bacterium]